MDNLTKWLKVFATADQTAPIIARFLFEKVISRHGVPNQLLSDSGTAFLLKLVLGVSECLGVKKLNTSAYHPQTYGLVERFNRTVTNMLAKFVSPGETEWDEHLPYILFAYCSAQQASTGESPFFLLYGHEPRLPSELVLHPSTDTRWIVQLDHYKSIMVREVGNVWKLSQAEVTRAQK